MTDFDEADVAAMRSEAGGAGFREFLRMQIAAGRTRHDAKPDPPPRPPGRTRGAWPSGTAPPPAPCSPADWHGHVAEYRAWLTNLNEQDPT